MKIITKYSLLILSTVLIIITIFDYIDYKQLLLQIEQENLLIDVMFNGWYVTFSFIIIALYELITKNKYFKVFIRFLLVLIFLGILLKNVIPIEDFDAGVENTTVFSGVITILLFLLLGLKKIYDNKYKLPAANSRS